MIKPAINNPKEWVIWFDLDDTLWDFSTNSSEALSDVYKEFDLNRFWHDCEEWRDDYHKINYELWNLFTEEKISQKTLRFERFFTTFVQGGMPEDEATEMAWKADIFYLKNLGQRKKIIPGANVVLQKLKQRGFRIGILSNGFKEVQYDKLESGGLSEFIDIVVLSDEININKPNVELFRYAQEKGEINKEHSIMIGDNGETDISGALNAEWSLAIWFNPLRKEPAEKLQAALQNPSSLMVISDLQDLESLFA